MADKFDDLLDDALIKELRRRGNIVGVVRKSDVVSVLAAREDLHLLPGDELDTLANSLIERHDKTVDSRVQMLGTDILARIVKGDGPCQKAAMVMAGRRATAGLIAANLEQRGVDPEFLDDLVHDCAEAAGAKRANRHAADDTQEEAIDAASNEASAINNGSLPEQVLYLLLSRVPKSVWRCTSHSVRPRLCSFSVRSDERSVGKEGFQPCRTRGLPDHYKK